MQNNKLILYQIVIIATHAVSDIEYIARNIIMLKKGIIINNAPSDKLIQNINGKVWNIICNESDVMRYQDKYRVINIFNNDDGVNLRILSEEKPVEETGVLTLNPTLEDYYLYIFGDEVRDKN